MPPRHLVLGAGRSLKRDALGIDSLDAELKRYRLRYLPAQRRYIEEQRPQERATFVLRNTSLDEPELVRRPRLR